MVPSGHISRWAAHGKENLVINSPEATSGTIEFSWITTLPGSLKEFPMQRSSREVKCPRINHDMTPLREYTFLVLQMNHVTTDLAVPKSSLVLGT